MEFSGSRESPVSAEERKYQKQDRRRNFERQLHVVHKHVID